MCGDPPVIDNGQINLDVDGEYFYQDTATVSCIQGYLPTIPQIQCTESGSWNTVQCGRIGKVGFFFSVYHYLYTYKVNDYVN